LHEAFDRGRCKVDTPGAAGWGNLLPGLQYYVAPNDGSKTVGAGRATRGRLATKKILLVEDHEDNRNIYRTILEHYGYQVVVAIDGQSGIRVAQEELPDLILMDLSIPVVDGWEATRVLKRGAGTSGIPVIALSAHALSEDRERAREAGCDGYLAKPVEPRKVLEEVARFLDDEVPATVP
jgi:CheY-like chemotaxis protein